MPGDNNLLRKYNPGFTVIPEGTDAVISIDRAYNPINTTSTGFIAQYQALQKQGKLLRSKSAPLNLSSDLQNVLTDEAGAFIFVQDRTGSKEITAMTNNFWLTSMAMSFKERLQITESFDSSHFMFMGNNIKIYNFAGFSIDGASSDDSDKGGLFYQSSLIQMYEEVLRGTVLTKKNRVAVLSVANHVIKGYPTDFAVSYSAEAGNLTQFNFSFIVVDHYLELEGVVNNKRLKNLYTPNVVGFDDRITDQLNIIDEKILSNQKNYLEMTGEEYKEIFTKLGINPDNVSPRPTLFLAGLTKAQKELTVREQKNVETLVKEIYSKGLEEDKKLQDEKATLMKSTLTEIKKALYK